MFLTYLTININCLPINRGFNYQQIDSKNYCKRGMVYRTHFMTSNNLDNLCKKIPDIKNIVIQDFDVKLEESYNAFLVPLFEIKDKAGKEIDEDFVKAIGFNNLQLDGKFIRPNTHGPSIGAKLIVVCGIKQFEFAMEASLVILNNTSMKKVLLHLFGIITEPRKIYYDRQPFFDDVVVDKFCFEVWGNVFENCCIDLGANNKYGGEADESVCRTKTNTISIIVTYKLQGYFSIEDSNVLNKHITIKQIGKKNSAKHFNNNTPPKDNNRMIGEQKEQISESKSLNKESQPTVLSNINILKKHLMGKKSKQNKVTETYDEDSIKKHSEHEDLDINQQPIEKKSNQSIVTKTYDKDSIKEHRKHEDLDMNQQIIEKKRDQSIVTETYDKDSIKKHSEHEDLDMNQQPIKKKSNQSIVTKTYDKDSIKETENTKTWIRIKNQWKKKAKQNIVTETYDKDSIKEHREHKDLDMNQQPIEKKRNQNIVTKTYDKDSIKKHREHEDLDMNQQSMEKKSKQSIVTETFNENSIDEHREREDLDMNQQSNTYEKNEDKKLRKTNVRETVAEKNQQKEEKKNSRAGRKIVLVVVIPIALILTISVVYILFSRRLSS
ncbi:hypothetical protein CDIK_3143 [Cucumispora dikerogammari]|nr:hypothetical protein CDIK_3143 [Cucumispora dikerogammari]